MRVLAFAILLLSWLAPTAAFALDPDEVLANPRLEARARALSSEFRCLVCQNESIEDSQAALAKDLRKIVRQRILAGQTNAQIKAYLVSRYGDFILLKPPFDWSTFLLWTTPLICLGAGGAAALQAARMTRKTPDESQTPLSEAERIRLAGLLVDRDGG